MTLKYTLPILRNLDNFPHSPPCCILFDPTTPPNYTQTLSVVTFGVREKLLQRKLQFKIYWSSAKKRDVFSGI